jgi:nitroreductase
MNAAEVTKALQWRYGVKVFDTEKKVSDADIRTILESAQLAPSGFGIEPWKFILVNKPDVRAKLRAVGYDQSKITDASHLVVVAYRTDAQALAAELVDRTAKAHGKTHEDFIGLKQMVEGSMSAKGESAKEWARSQSYIALGMMIETAALLGVDSGPMEGFNNAQVDEILGLKEQHLASTSMIAFGYRGDDIHATYPKVRRAYDEVVEVID